MLRSQGRARYEMLKRGEEWKDLGGDYFERRNPEKTKRKLVKRLEALGYDSFARATSKARKKAAFILADSLNPNANNSVVSIAVQADGKILAGGNFSGVNSIGGQTRNRIARLDATTGLADSFDPNANNSVYAIALQADGKILVGGNFNGTNSIGGQTRNRIARLDATTGLADSFDPNANNTVYAIALQADGKILAGGVMEQSPGAVH